MNNGPLWPRQGAGAGTRSSPAAGPRRESLLLVALVLLGGAPLHGSRESWEGEGGKEAHRLRTCVCWHMISHTHTSAAEGGGGGGAAHSVAERTKERGKGAQGAALHVQRAAPPLAPSPALRNYMHSSNLWCIGIRPPGPVPRKTKAPSPLTVDELVEGEVERGGVVGRSRCLLRLQLRVRVAPPGQHAVAPVVPVQQRGADLLLVGCRWVVGGAVGVSCGWPCSRRV